MATKPGKASRTRALSDAERALIDVATALSARLNVQETCAAVLQAVETVFGARSSWILLKDPGSGDLVTVDFRGPGADTYSGVKLPTNRGIVGLAFSRGEPVFVPDVREESRWFDAKRVQRSGLRSVFTVPLVFEDEPVGVVGLDSPRFTANAPPTPADIARLRGIAAQAAIAIRNARLVESLEQDRTRLRKLLHQRRQLRNEVGHLRDAVREAKAYSDVIGESAALKEVLRQVELVAPADTTVLIVGETGTGKELIARAIHESSRRRLQPFVAVNCAALPDSLVESELFGYERGAFTGAYARTPGKFELADKGTLFLDEIGDLPAGAQAKLLRVLQEREVYRVGGNKPVRINVRLLAATNRNLEQAIQADEFRRDLYYRLSVFPVFLPPLRERLEDIPALAEYFVRRFADRQGKEITNLSEDAMRQMVSYNWPGNIRELQNVLERAVILAREPVIGLDLVAHRELPARQSAVVPVTAPAPAVSTPAPVVPFSEAERRAITRALDLTGWRISGRGGAAEVLGLKPTTLHAKMKKLGIRRPTAAARGEDAAKAQP